MTKLFQNTLLLWSLVVAAAYVAAGAIIPNPYVSSATSFLLLIFGAVTFVRYAPDAFRVLFQGVRSEEGDGAHLATLGIALVSAGSMYVGLFGLLWVYFGQPAAWLGTAASGAGRGAMAAGFALLFFSPDVANRRFRLPGSAWLIFAIAIAGAVVFALGWRMGQHENMATYRTAYRNAEARMVCPDTHPVLISSRDKFHTAVSPYRDMVSPRLCFESGNAAAEAGFEAPH